MNLQRWLACFSCAAVCACAGRPPEPKREGLLLRDFAPRSMLRSETHAVPKARFPVVDFHQHLRMPGEAKYVTPAAIIAAMDERNVKMMVHLTAGWGEELQKAFDLFAGPHPDRFKVFTEIDWTRVDEPSFGQEQADAIRDAVRRGARGLKVWKRLGLMVRLNNGKLITVDDARLDPIWAVCGELAIPVAIHVADPPAMFEPVDGHNERFEEVSRGPSFHGRDFPTMQAVLEARDRVFARHPGTMFVAQHFGGWPENLDYVAKLLDTHLNVLVDTAGRVNELGRQPRRARRFFIDHQDRILFGTDASPSPNSHAGGDHYPPHYRWLETADEYFEYPFYPLFGRWHISGLELPDEVLEKIYAKNAEALFARFKG